MESSAGREPQQARGERSRERILEATLAVIARVGIPRMTHRLVAEEAAIPVGTLTYWFPTRDDLLRHALRRFGEVRMQRVTDVLAALEPGTAPARFAAQLAEALTDEDQRGDQLAILELYLEAARNPALQPIARDTVKASDAIMARVLGAMGAEQPAELASTAQSLAQGLTLRRLATGSAPPLDLTLLGLVRPPS